MSEAFLTEDEIRKLKQVVKEELPALQGQITMLQRQVDDLKQKYELHHHDYDDQSPRDPYDPFIGGQLQTSEPKDPKDY